MQVFKIQINYKSGISVVAEFDKFSINNGTYTWVNHDNCCGPILLNPEEIESIWQIGIREVEEVKND